MAAPRIPLNWLRAFEVAARHLNLSAAARELHVTPAAVSQQVRLLEHHLGAVLFERNARGVRLTRAGESLLPVCRESFERMDAALLELFGKRRGDRLIVRVLLGFARAWVLDAAAGFARAHPDIPFRLVASVWPGEPQDASVDVDLRLASSPPKGLEVHPLTRDAIFPVGVPALARKLRRGGTSVDWSAQTLLHSVGFAQGWRQWLTAAQVQRSARAGDLEFDSTQLCLEAAARGYGIALGRTSFVADYLADGRLAELPGPRMEARDQVFLTIAPGLDRQAPAAVFRDFLLQRVGDAPGLAAGRPGRARRTA
ncbi:MAG: LysR family transcriptional regulator [Rhodoferax sp.]